MGMSIFDMFDEDTAVSLQVGRGVVNFRYNTSRLSPANMADLAEVEAEDSDLRSMAHSLLQLARVVASLVTWWDVLDDDGQTVALTADTVATLPLPFLKMVMEAITRADAGEAQPGRTMKTISADTSPALAKSAPAPNGIPSSRPLIDSTARPGKSYPQLNHSNGRKRR